LRNLPNKKPLQKLSALLRGPQLLILVTFQSRQGMSAGKHFGRKKETKKKEGKRRVGATKRQMGVLEAQGGKITGLGKLDGGGKLRNA